MMTNILNHTAPGMLISSISTVMPVIVIFEGISKVRRGVISGQHHPQNCNPGYIWSPYLDPTVPSGVQ